MQCGANKFTNILKTTSFHTQQKTPLTQCCGAKANHGFAQLVRCPPANQNTPKLWELRGEIACRAVTKQVPTQVYLLSSGLYRRPRNFIESCWCVGTGLRAVPPIGNCDAILLSLTLPRRCYSVVRELYRTKLDCTAAAGRARTAVPCRMQAGCRCGSCCCRLANNRAGLTWILKFVSKSCAVRIFSSHWQRNLLL